MYKLLVLGNGFDLACGFSTRYTDFLNFLRFIDPKKDKSEFIPIDDDIEKLVDKELEDNNSELASYRNYVPNNVWIQHFMCVEKNLPKDRKWMDFEAEMSRVLHAIDEFKKEQFAGNPMSSDNDIVLGFPPKLDNYPWIYLFFDDEQCRYLLREYLYDAYLIDRMRNLNDLLLAKYKKVTPGTLDPFDQKKLASFNKTRENMLSDLKDLIDLLDYYLRVYASKHKIKNTDVAPEIINTLNWFKSGPDSTKRILLTFNYTDAFTTLMHACHYDIPENLNICHIHGEIGKGNIVLGIDDNEQSNDVFWGQFEKYYQKIHNKVDGSFYDFTNSSDYQHSDHEVKFIGHSFAITDKHPLKKLLTMPRTKIECLYKDDNSELIRNITAIIGKDAILEKALGNSGTLKFTKITTDE